MPDVMNWSSIVAAVVLPLIPAFSIAWPFWGRSRDSLGSCLGVFAVFVFALAFAGREYVHIQRLTNECLAAEKVCRFYPEPFTRFCVYVFIAMGQAFVLFYVGSIVEHRRANKVFAAEWRR